MDRRNFLRSLIGGVAAGAAVRTWPFRVYSFPKEPVHLYGVHYLPTIEGSWAGLSRATYPGRLLTQPFLGAELSPEILRKVLAQCEATHVEAMNHFLKGI